MGLIRLVQETSAFSDRVDSDGDQGLPRYGVRIVEFRLWGMGNEDRQPVVVRRASRSIQPA